MSKLESKEIIKLLEILIGDTEAYGETNHDEKALENLKTLIDVTNWCLDGIYTNQQKKDYEYSVCKARITAESCLLEYLEWLKYIFSEGEEE